MTIHNLKTAEPYFTDVSTGKKTFELRQYSAQGKRPTRDFKVGDTVRLFSSRDGCSTERLISYILKDTDPHMKGRLMPGYCILGLSIVCRITT